MNHRLIYRLFYSQEKRRRLRGGWGFPRAACVVVGGRGGVRFRAVAVRPMAACLCRAKGLQGLDCVTFVLRVQLGRAAGSRFLRRSQGRCCGGCQRKHWRALPIS